MDMVSGCTMDARPLSCACSFFPPLDCISVSEPTNALLERLPASLKLRALAMGAGCIGMLLRLHTASPSGDEGNAGASSENAEYEFEPYRRMCCGLPVGEWALHILRD